MVSYRELIDPMGNTGYGSRDSGPLLSALSWGLVISQGILPGRFNPLDKRYEYKDDAIARKKLIRRGDKLKKFRTGSINIDGGYTSVEVNPSSSTLHRNALSRSQRNKLLSSREFNLVKSTRSQISNKWSSIRSSVKMLGWMTVLSDITSVATDVFSPSPALAASAQKTESSFLGNQIVYQNSMTNRQRAIQAIHDSQLSINPILGNEANYLHK